MTRKASESSLVPAREFDLADDSAVAQSFARDSGPATPVEVGVKRFVDWFVEYYGYKR